MALGADTHTHMRKHTDARAKAISRNQVRAAKGRARLIKKLDLTNTYNKIYVTIR